MKAKILKMAGIILLVLISFVLTAPCIIKGKITSLVRARISKDLRAHVNFSGVDISLFRNFPKITIGLDNLQVDCVGEFQGDTLITVKQLNLACNLGSLISGDSVKVYSITFNEPRFHALINKYGHSNWNIIKSDNYSGEHIDSSFGVIQWKIQRYAIHNGYVDYTDERKNMHVVVLNLEHEGRGNFSSDLFTVKTKTTADAINFNYSGAIPYQVIAKAGIDISFHVDTKTRIWSFNTDQVVFNDLKLHTEGFFQWINDSSYNLSIKYKAPSTNFKNILSMMPSIYQKDFASMVSNGQINLNGFIKGKYDEKHFPAYHTNLYVQNGYFKYPDLPAPVENINIGLQIDNPDGMADHTTINLSEAHAEINHDSLDLHFLVKNLKTNPFIDFAFTGKLDLANISKSIKLASGTALSGNLVADIHAKGNIPEAGNHKKEQFQSGGNLNLVNFSYSSGAFPGGIALNELLLGFNSKNVMINKLTGAYLNTRFDATGTLNNLFDFALGNQPLKATIDVKADEFNLRDWIRSYKTDSAAIYVHVIEPLIVPDNIDFTIHAEAEHFHFDNLDLQDLSGKLLISNETVQMIQLKANGMDGIVILDGTYSTLENREKPEIALTYDVKGLDVQKAFLAFYTVRKIVPVGKFITGNCNAHLILKGSLNADMTTDLQSLYGEGNLELPAGEMKDFGPMDKLTQSLDIASLKDIPLKDIKADFTFKAGKVEVSPFLVLTKDIGMEIGGSHSFDQALDYNINLKVPRSQLGSKGNMFVKNVVKQAADKGIPVKLKDAVSMNVKMGGTINNPDVKPDMNAVVDHAASDLKKEVEDFVNAKLDSAKQQLHNPTVSSKKQLFVQANYKPKTSVKAKKSSKSSAHKKSTHTKAKKKHKKSSKNYSAAVKKEKSTVSNGR